MGLTTQYINAISGLPQLFISAISSNSSTLHYIHQWFPSTDRQHLASDWHLYQRVLPSIIFLRLRAIFSYIPGLSHIYHPDYTSFDSPYCFCNVSFSINHLCPHCRPAPFCSAGKTGRTPRPPTAAPLSQLGDLNPTQSQRWWTGTWQAKSPAQLPQGIFTHSPWDWDQPTCDPRPFRR